MLSSWLNFTMHLALVKVRVKSHVSMSEYVKFEFDIQNESAKHVLSQIMIDCHTYLNLNLDQVGS
jgi:hypothetical protein